MTDLSKQEYLNASQSNASAKDKISDPSAPKRDKFSGLSRRQKRRKMAVEADKEFNDKGAVDSAIRAAKQAQRPRKIGDDAPQPSFAKKNRKVARKQKKPGHTSAKAKTLGKDSKFKAEMGVKRRGGTTEGIRAKKGDGGILGGKKGGKGGGKSKVKGRR
jgi:ATP-dependent RNA helicase DDX27